MPLVDVAHDEWPNGFIYTLLKLDSASFVVGSNGYSSYSGDGSKGANNIFQINLGSTGFCVCFVLGLLNEAVLAHYKTIICNFP